MAEVYFPLSGPVVQNFTIAPFSWGGCGPTATATAPYNINPPQVGLGFSNEPEAERELVSRVGSYGRQVGIIGEALVALMKIVEATHKKKLSELHQEAGLPDDDLTAIEVCRDMVKQIDQIKGGYRRRHGNRHR